MKKRIILITAIVSLIIILIIVIVIILTNKKSKINRYSKIISTSNISYVEYKINSDAGPIYDESNYRTLTSEETANFINSINDKNLKYEYWGKPNQYKGIYYNTFIIHYEDGEKTVFDICHIEKYDNKGNRTYFEIVFPYECELGENLFKTIKRINSSFLFIIKQKYDKMILVMIMKKTLFLIPLVLVLVSCKKKGDNPLKYELNLSNTYTAILEEGSTAKKVSVPKKYNGKAITELSGFRNNSYIESVTFTSNITKIDAGTFTFCEHLKKISVSNSDTFKTIDGNLYDNKSLLVYASGKTNETFETDYNISSKAFTSAPNLKKIRCNGKEIEKNAFMFLESIEEIYISTKTNTIDDDFIYGLMPKRLVVNNRLILNTLKVKDIKEVYVAKNSIVSEDFLSKYKYVEDKIIDKETYLYYEVK